VVDYAITLPESFQVLADNLNGTVIVDSIHNLVSVGNVNGQITLNEIFGSAFVALVNGRIEGEITLPLEGTISMNLVNGNIDLDIPANTSAEFSISVTGLHLQNQVSSPTSLRGTLGEGEGTISLTTVNGNISVSGF
jgi:DUF4097 and DUF4098 domain-containing protein YvlB